MRHVAVIGAGPSGLYLIDHLLKAAPDIEVDVLERLPTPLGLVRYGVAPDHQSTKGVARLLDRILSRDRVRYWGNVSVGEAVSLQALLENYDAVVLATGAGVDRHLGIPGEDLPGVYGSGEFVGWYNNHPDRSQLCLPQARNAIVIGAGNVAIDVARLLVKRGEELAGSDLAPEVEAQLGGQPLETVTIVARSAAVGARFTELELAELGELEHVRTAVFDPDGIVGEGPVLDTLRTLAEGGKQGSGVSLDLRFALKPVAVLGDGAVSGLRVVGRDGVAHDLPAELIVTCIGYETADVCGQSTADGFFANDDGRVADRLYAVGWCKRGPSGTIPTNRSEAAGVAARIAAETVDGGRKGPLALRELVVAAAVNVVDYAGWRRIDQHEVARAPEGRVRHKHASVDELVASSRAR